MKIRNLMTIGLMAAGIAAMAQAQTYRDGGYNNPAPGRYAVEPRYDERRFDERRDIGRDLRVRENLLRRIEADRRAVEHERWELRDSPYFAAGHEYRELRAAEERLEGDVRELRTLNGDVNRDFNRYGRERFRDRW